MCKNVQKCAKIKSETENSLKKTQKIKQNVQKCAKMCKNVQKCETDLKIIFV